MQPHIRRAHDDDGDAISMLNAELHALHADALPWRFRRVGLNAFPLEGTIALLGKEDCRFLVAEVGSAIVGYVYAEIVRRPETETTHGYEAIYVHHLYVRPAFQRRGIGRALLDAARDVGAAAGVARLALDVWTFNEAARAFFRGYGLKPYNERLWDG